MISGFTVSSFADDGGGGDAGAVTGDSGMSGLSGLGDGGSGSNAGSSSQSGAGVMVPPIIAAPGVTGNSVAGGQQNGTTDVITMQDSDANQDKNADSDDGDDDTNQAKAGRGKGIRKVSGTSGYDPFPTNVYIRTGLTLKKFASNLFRTPSSYTPSQNIPVPANYVVGPGDYIDVQTWGAVNSSIRTKVKSDGTIFVPKLGEVSVTGVKQSQLSSYMKGKLGKIYRNFELSGNVSKVKTIQVTVAGMANRPGTYYLSSLSSMSNAIFAVGGPSAVGSMRDVELKRHGATIAHFDLYDLIINGKSQSDVQLVAGDVIVFKPLGNEVAIYDGVKRPFIYELKSHETVSDLLHYAGGYTSDAKTDKIIIETVNANKEIAVNDYQTNLALSKTLSDGAIIHLFKAMNKYTDSVAVIGNVAHPSRFAYRQGMRVKDLIPGKEALLTASYYNSYSFNTYGQDNALTQVGVEKTTNQSGAGGLNLTTGLQSTQNLSNTKPVFGGGQNLFTAGPVSIPEANINWNYALIVRQDPKNFSTHIIPFNLRKALEGDSHNNLQLMPGDIVNVLSAKDVRTASAGGSIYVFIDGEVNSPGVYELKAGQSLRDIIESAGGVSAKAYVFGLELSRESVKKQQTVALNQMLDQAQQSILAAASTSMGNVTSADQAKTQQVAMQQQLAFINKMRLIKPSGRVVLNLGSSKVKLTDLPNFKLENGDTVYIPPTPDTINVVGQVYNPATFMYNPHYTVKKYIDLAGTENTYADTSVEYVLRADGTLYSKQQSGWFGSFSGQTLNPGDVVIVPQQVQFGGLVQNLMNWTQVLANSAQVVALFAR